ncbi:ferrous iron transport protein A [Pseudovibrio sp. SPO723]|uniref:FeoA family protein n=1 Tax=Nesiotobacter zosterae TaxID=392721 RepID=UPI0029C1B8D5|nr:ferrous iron transport protein A [Pseudovibrio sp. SPO723]MDX5592913.1 ferrous iron transport protein A [Pseudovibrio sp. SPO723]
MQRQVTNALAPTHDAQEHNPAAHSSPSLTWLSDAPLNTEVRITRLGHSRQEVLHLRSLGLSEKQALTVLRGRNTEPRIIASGANRVALGVDLARTIKVEVA